MQFRPTILHFKRMDMRYKKSKRVDFIHTAGNRRLAALGQSSRCLHMSETQVHHIQAQLEPADGSFPGQVTEGYYVVDDGILTMTDAGGGAVEIDGRRFTVTLGPDTNARAIASICCSPPDRSVPLLPRRSFRRGNIS